MFDNCNSRFFTYTWYNCPLSQQSVDNILVSLNTAGKTNGVLYLNSVTSSPPSATGIAAKNSLISKGWTVITN
jgi:hypothetical protein